MLYTYPNILAYLSPRHRPLTPHIRICRAIVRSVPIAHIVFALK